MLRDAANTIVAGIHIDVQVELMHKDNEVAVTSAEQVGGGAHGRLGRARVNTPALDRYRHHDSGAVVKLFEEATGTLARRR